MATKKPFSRIDKLKSLPVLGRKPKPSWFDRLPAADRDELAEFRRQWQAGEHAGRTEIVLYEYWQDELKLTIEKSAFFNWLKRRNLG